MTKDVVIVELNEFNVELLSNATKLHSLPSLSKVLSLKRSQYKTNDRYNSGFLEPWVQWVSIHASTPSNLHQIKHLGDVPDLGFEQCWETLSRYGVSTGIWGVMNGAKNQAKNVRFFLPDPWTFSESAYPKALTSLLSLPRYVAKNYQNLSKIKLVFKACQLLKFTFTSGAACKIIKQSIQLLKDLQHFGKKHFVYISYFDTISTMLFAQYKKKYKPQCSIIFLNSLAHLQHHHWHNVSSVSPEILHGLKAIDKIFAYLFAQFPHDAFVVHNGLSQMNTNHEKSWVLYRQKDPLKFMKDLEIPALKVEQNMTHDGHAFFATAEDCQIYYEALSKASIDNKPLFHIEKNAHDPCKLFYMLSFTDEVNQDQTFMFNGKPYSFFSHFDSIVTRTGRHIPVGTIFSDTITFNDQIYNHDFNRYLFHYFKPDIFTLPEDATHEIDEKEFEAFS
ncbi:MAG: hypothetical protein HYX61_11815 [Gammaproteobacteria bacterium]|nr:hypothetical protein [Gammaproteobacteria bacterium]